MSVDKEMIRTKILILILVNEIKLAARRKLIKYINKFGNTGIINSFKIDVDQIVVRHVQENFTFEF